MSLCQYREAGGTPRMGLHALRIPLIDVAFWDVVGTLLIAVLIAHILKTNVVSTVLIAFLLGCAAHIVFCVPTTVTRFILGIPTHSN